ncbi:MAG: S9 family peptidase, partial [Candidatus Dormibacteraeota bacterium]|nr:S9 family peptidase [Candidatus Dormibacteraeota bacterium]
MAGKRPVAIEDLERIWSIDAVSWRRGRQQVAIAVSRPDLARDRDRRQVRLVDLETGRTAPLRGDGEESTSPAWSPDGSRLAFLRKRGGRSQELAIRGPEGEVHVYSGLLAEGVTAFVWAPDSRRLCLVGPSHTPARDAGDRQPRVVERLPYKSDGAGFTHDLSAHLYLFDLESERLDQLTSGPWQDREPAWSSDGRRIAFASERHDERGRDLGADLFVLEVGSGELCRLTATTGQVHTPCWSPDGTLLAYAGTDRLRSAPSHRRLWVVESAGGSPRCVSGVWDRGLAVGAPGGIVFLADRCVAALFEDEGRVTWAGFDPTSGRKVASGPPQQWQIAAWAPSPDRRSLAYAASSPARPPELFLEDEVSEGARQVTHLHDAWRDQVRLSEVEPFEAESEEGVRVPAWFLPPTHRADGERVPVMLRIHGGPYAQYGVGFSLESQYWAGRGYGLVFGNPRGSSGYDEGWARALGPNRGSMDQRDVLAELDEALRRWPWLDGERAIVEGYSYGGYLTSWLVGHTGRFRVACSGAAPNNLYSQQGTTDLTATNYPFTWGFTILERPEHYVERSPITYVNRI